MSACLWRGVQVCRAVARSASGAELDCECFVLEDGDPNDDATRLLRSALDALLERLSDATSDLLVESAGVGVRLLLTPESAYRLNALLSRRVTAAPEDVPVIDALTTELINDARESAASTWMNH